MSFPSGFPVARAHLRYSLLGLALCRKLRAPIKQANRHYPAGSDGGLQTLSLAGNIRELRNFIERAVILSPGQKLNAPLEELQELTPTCPEGDSETRTATLQELERGHILKALAQTRWLVGGPNGAATLLGLNRTTLLSRMQKLGISRRPQNGEIATGWRSILLFHPQNRPAAPARAIDGIDFRTRSKNPVIIGRDPLPGRQPATPL